MPRVAGTRIGNVFEGGQENLHRREGSMRSPNATESNSASDASTDHRAVSSKNDSPEDVSQTFI
jgi:hypothetical protein